MLLLIYTSEYYHCYINILNRITRKFILSNRQQLGAGSAFKANVRRANLALQTTAIVALFSFSIFLLDLSFGNYLSCIADIVLVTIAICCYFIIIKGYISTGKLILVIAAIFIISINASAEGRYAGNQYLWYVSLVGIFTLFTLQEKKMLFLSLGLLLGSLFFVDFTDFSFLSKEVRNADWTQINHRVILYFSFLVCTFFLYFIAKSIGQSFHDKDRDNRIITKQNQQLIQAQNELDKFVYHASHDLRAPLTSMLGLIEVSKNETDFEKVKSLLSKQEETILKLDDYVTDILTLSRVKNTELQLESLNINRILERILKQCQFMIDEKKMKVKVDCHPKALFRTDSKRLSIILSNVISNSIKYTDPQKKINKIEIKVEVQNNKLQISIRDNGVGINKDELDKVVGMFYFNKNENKGTGLGLYIVKETINSLGGNLHITSKIKSFTQVYITIP